MIRLLPALAVLCASGAALAQTPPPQTHLSLDHRMMLRCSAAFALVAGRQAAGDAEALAFPVLDTRGREYFVRASAQVMDEAGLDRAGVTEALGAEARDLVGNGTLAQMMPVCLSLLPAG